MIRAMVIRRRLRSILLPLLLYAVSGSVSAYFIWHAVNGERGLKTKEEYRKVMADLVVENAGLRAEHEQYARRISMMRAEAVERDILEEEARVQLGRVHKNDVVIFLKPVGK